MTKFWQKIAFALIMATLIAVGSSCYSYHAIELEVLQYPQKPLPVKVQTVAFVDKTCPKDRDSVGYIYTIDHQQIYSTDPADSTLSASFINGLKSTFYRSGFYRLDDTPLGFEDFSYDSVQQQIILPAGVEVDLVVVLDRLSIKDVTDFTFTNFHEFMARLLFWTEATVSIFSTASPALVQSLHLTDFTERNAYEMTKEGAYNMLPRRREWFPEALFAWGEKVAQNFVPYWKETERKIIGTRLPSTLQTAVLAAQQDAWSRAAYYWENITKNGTKKQVAAAHFNLAVYQEIQGDTEAALKHLEQSKILKNFKISTEYYQTLQSEMEKNRLLHQLQSH